MSQTALLERRSVNNFDREKDLSIEKLKEIIDLAVHAPSAFNLEPYRIIAVQSEEDKESLFNLANQQPKIKEAPYNLIIIGDREAYGPQNPAWKELESMAGEDATKGAMSAAAFLYGSSDERKIKFAESNAGLLAMSIMYSAKILGVDSHPMSGVDFDGIKEKFDLRENEDVVMVISLGYHDQSQPLYPRRSRKKFDSLVEIK
jgi:putative NAD(P)H nitroreductase